MDILDIIIAVLIIVGSVLFSARKKNKQTPPYEPYNDDENLEWDTPVEDHNWETILQKNAKSNPNPYFYDNLEKIGNKEKEILKNEIACMQDVELEKEVDDSFLISHEEMRKAIIYSEILKFPYFEKFTKK